MLTVNLYNHFVDLILQEEAPIDLLKDLQGYLSYNDTIYRYEKLKRARNLHPEIDMTNPSELEEMAYMCSEPWYQNFLCYTLNLIRGEKNKLYNFVQKQNFPRNEMSEGYRTVLKVDYLKRKTRIKPGLLRLALMYLQDQAEEEYGLEWDFVVDDRRDNKVYLTPEPVYEWKGISLRPEQRDVVDKIRTTLSDHDNYGYLFTRIMLELSVNFGKTVTLYVICKNFTLEDGSPAPVIWFYSDRELLSKAVEDYLPLEPDLTVLASDKSYVNTYLSARGVDARPTYAEQGAFTLAMVQTTDARIKKKKINARTMKPYVLGIYDECHKGSGDRVARVLSKFRFGCLVGASGSPTSSNSGATRFDVTGNFGAVRHKIEFKDTVDLGRSLPLEVWRLHNPIPTKYATNSYNVSRVKRTGVYGSEQRYNLIRAALDYSIRDERQTLIYGGNIQIKDLQYWYERLKADGYKLDFTYGDDPDRVEKIAAFSRRDTEVLFSNRIVGTGVDIPTIGSLIYLAPTDNEIDVLQAPIGRLGRVFKGKGKHIEKGIIFDFLDDDRFIDIPFGGFLEDQGEGVNIPGELTRISEIRAMYYRDQNIPILDKTLEDLL